MNGRAELDHAVHRSKAWAALVRARRASRRSGRSEFDHSQVRGQQNTRYLRTDVEFGVESGNFLFGRVQFLLETQELAPEMRSPTATEVHPPGELRRERSGHHH